jgi:HSP20 family protein
MAETKTNRSESAKEGSQTLTRQERDSGAVQPRGASGNWVASPFDVFDRMAEEMDRTFDRMFRDFGMPRRSWLTRPSRSRASEGLWAPRIEAFQKGDRYIVRADLPGLKKDDVQVELTNEALTIRGERREEKEEDREGYYHSEREYGGFYRNIPLPEGVIAESAQASFNNGVLEISIQAPPAETRSRRLEIKDASEGADKK